MKAFSRDISDKVHPGWDFSLLVLSANRVCIEDRSAARHRGPVLSFWLATPSRRLILARPLSEEYGVVKCTTSQQNCASLKSVSSQSCPSCSPSSPIPPSPLPPVFPSTSSSVACTSASTDPVSPCSIDPTSGSSFCADEASLG